MFKWLAAVAGACALTSFVAAPTDALPEVLSLKLFNIHTQAQGTFVFKRNGVYDQEGLAQLNEFLRDWRRDQPTHMDPHLFDLLYQAYRESGSHDFIHVVCGYRTPDTNAMLRHRSKLVAQNSLHMQGRAMDFFIPDVPLAKLRVIGMRLQSGGVGFYPTSGSPFVHMDTGSVRHWPRMSRQELIAAFPDGKTLDIPTDGKPLPGYAEALADYQSRTARGGALADYAVASNAKPVVFTRAEVAAADARADRTGGDDGPMQLAENSGDDEDNNAADAAPAPKAVAPVAKAAVPTAVAVASVAPAPNAPLPHLAPHNTTAIASLLPPTPHPFDVAAFAAPAPAPQPVAAANPASAADSAAPAAPLVLASAAALTLPVSAKQPLTAPANRVDFGSQDWSAPAVPAELARAMAARDQVRRGASLPIMPTSVVATIDVNRPLRAEAITTAVLRTSTDPQILSPGILAYADPGLTTASIAAMPAPMSIHRAAMTSAGVPLPQLRPLASAGNAPVRTLRVVRPHMEAPPLTMTSLDTQGLRLWMSSQSTRQKAYALLTMPDFAQQPGLMTPPTVTFSAGFGRTAYTDLRTDRFSGPLVEQPAMVDVSGGAEIASIQ